MNIAAQAGRNAAANNFLNHAEASRRLKLQIDLQGCADAACRSSLQAEIDHLNRLDSWRDAQIEQACQIPSSDSCRGWSAAINQAATSYHGKTGNLLDVAERSSVQQQAFKYQRAANNPFMHGVGTGLLKLTPPGLLVGAVGGVAMTVQAVVENGLSETLIESANAIVNLPADLNARLNSADPAVRGEAFVDLISLGSGATAATAGGVKVSIDSVKRAQVAKAVAEAESKARDQAKIDNNFYGDGAPIEYGSSVFVTNPNEAVFWSGRTGSIGGQATAKEIANAHKGKTLEDLMESRLIHMPDFDPTDISSVNFWKDVSVELAKNASGEVRAVIGIVVRPKSIWETYELPTLINNPAVTKIIIIDPKTKAESIIHNRRVK